MEKEYSRYMSNFRGIDATSDSSNVSLNRFSFIQNMYKDYKSGQGVAIETFPGTRTLCNSLNGKIFGIHAYKVSSGKVHVIVHAGTKLYHFDSAERDKLSDTAPAEFPSITMKEAKSSSFVYNNRLYLIDGENYIVVYEDKDKNLIAEHVDNDTAYVPTTFSNEVEYEQRNMLTNKFIEKSRLEKLDYNEIKIPQSPSGAFTSNYTITDEEGEKEIEAVVACPLIYHRSQRSSKLSDGRWNDCFCGHIDANAENCETNDFRETSLTIPKNYKYVAIDFDKSQILWSECYPDRPLWFFTKKNDLGEFYTASDGWNWKRIPKYHPREDELVSIDELIERKTDQETNEDGIYRFGFYRGISSHYLFGDDAEANRRKLLTSFSMENDVEIIIGNFLGCSNLASITLSDNITELDENFFAGTAIEIAYLPYNLMSLGKNAFKDCSKLKTIYVSAAQMVGSKSMYAILKSAEGKENYGISDDVEIISYQSKFMSGIPHGDSDNIETEKPILNRVYIRTPCEKVTSVSINNGEIPELITAPKDDGIATLDKKVTLYTPIYKYIGGKRYVVAIDFYHLCYEEGIKITGSYWDPEEEKDVIISEWGIVPGGSTEVNGTVEIRGEAHPSVFTTLGEASEENKDALSSHKNYSGEAVTAIKHCTVCCTFDDRIFFTGNPELPNTVFYTHRDLTGHINPTYVGVLNWFDDGMGNSQNTAMMSNASTLMVLKGNTLQDGSIYYHTGADGGNDMTPRIYPSIEGLAGLGCTGMAVNFRDDCVFMSNRGLEAIAKQTVNLERTIEHRSTNIDGLMLQSDLSSARAAEWEGYLCILIDGKMFLADSRQAFEGIGGALEYEWYYVDPVCGYDEDNPKYYLVDYMDSKIEEFCKKNGIGISESENRHIAYIDEDKNGENDLVKSTVSDTGITVYYVEVDSTKYLVSSSEERENGTPDKACEICAVEDVLLFGTENGKLLCLNNDKRGTSEYGDDKNSIPVEWYNNSGHAYVSVAVLANENAGVPHYTKTTVKRGTILRLKAFPSSAFEVYATTDRQATTLLTRQSNSVTTFDNFDLENIGLLTTDSNILAIKEKTKKWVEKQYRIMSGEHNKPFGLYSITYRYTIAGEVKNR